MIKSELIEKLAAENIHLTHAEVERLVNVILGKRRLGQVELLRGPGEGQFLGHGSETLEFAQGIVHTETVS